ncbi:MAG TPA: carboxylesterase family protein [Rhizomicrobium sp.]|jgi:para-nitrobenzyl esterase|nr:carboxylesterase family protein [Rhizomicrobium sp.]
MQKTNLIARLAMTVALAGTLALDRADGATADPTRVITADGLLHGQTVGDVVAFKGVPFAAPPVGALRWREPMPVQHWSGTRAALSYGAPCAQADMGWNSNVAAKSSEDCLYLNVWAPARHDKPLPVMIFFPGGAYHGGSAEGLSIIEPSYDGGKLAARGAVVLTANYRLGMFGFMAHPELSAESPHHVSGNYALMDNIAALKWIRANIAKFGGDPNNVTIFGQSAGAFSVGFLMTSPLAKGLFAKAISESGTVLRGGQPVLKNAAAAGAKYTQSLGGPAKGAIAALRQKSAADLIKIMMADKQIHASEPRGPIVDGYVFPEQPALVFQSGREAAVPYIVGATARDGDEDSMGVSGTPKADKTLADKSRPLSATHSVAGLTAADNKQVQAFYAKYSDLAAQAAKLYGDRSMIDPIDGDAITSFNTDAAFRCAGEMVAQWHARVAPSWQYQFSHGYEPLGAVHLWDMFYVFGWLKAPADQPRDSRLVDQTQRYMIAFATNGDPNTPGLPAWPKSGASGAYMDFASGGVTVRNGLRSAACHIFAQKTERDLTALAKSR